MDSMLIEYIVGSVANQVVFEHYVVRSTKDFSFGDIFYSIA